MTWPNETDTPTPAALKVAGILAAASVIAAVACFLATLLGRC